MPKILVEFCGYQERRDRPPLALWTLLVPVGPYPAGTTLCSATLTALGIPTPDDPRDLCGEDIPTRGGTSTGGSAAS